MKDVMRRAAFDSAGTLYSRLITLVDFALRTDEHTDLARVSIFCCATDAQLARVHLAGATVAQADRGPTHMGPRRRVIMTPDAATDAAAVMIPSMAAAIVATPRRQPGPTLTEPLSAERPGSASSSFCGAPSACEVIAQTSY